MTRVPLSEHHDVGLFDLDGVVYAGSARIEHAAESIAAARRAGMRAAFVTNNASRTPADVAAKLAEAGVPAEIDDIITSAQVAAGVLAKRLEPGSAVLVVGDRGLYEAVSDVGLHPVRSAEDRPSAVVQGHSPETGWQQLAEATIAVRAGALWVATNADSTIPTDRGVLAGNGAFVRLVAGVLGRDPDVVAGKPERTMHRASVEHTAARLPLVIGDRLDTDIEGATSSGCDSLYVMTGVSAPAEVVAAPPHRRPTYVASDLRGLLHPGISIAAAGANQAAGRWRARDGRITADPESAPGRDDAADYLAIACAVAWQTTADQADESSATAPRAADDAARKVAAELGLAI